MPPFDQIALAAFLAAKDADKDKKKDDKEEMPKPISGKERDRVARNLFVERVSQIYKSSLATELSSGTAISHSSKWGLDPARLLREGDEDEEATSKSASAIHIDIDDVDMDDDDDGEDEDDLAEVVSEVDSDVQLDEEDLKDLETMGSSDEV